MGTPVYVQTRYQVVAWRKDRREKAEDHTYVSFTNNVFRHKEGSGQGTGSWRVGEEWHGM